MPRSASGLREAAHSAVVAGQPAPTSIEPIARAVEDNPEMRRIELRDGGELLGWAEYLPGGDSVILAHTEVGEAHEGEGLGGEIVRAALDRIRGDGKTVIPTCPFAAAYIRRHPELAEYVDPSMRGQFAAG